MAQILPFTSLASATSVGPGVSMDLNGTSNEFTLFGIATGSPTSAGVQLEGSHDGVNWFNLPPGLNLAGGGGAAGQVQSTEFTNTNDNGGGQPATATKPHARYVRAHLTNLAGGTAPTVTATIAVGKVV